MGVLRFAFAKRFFYDQPKEDSLRSFLSTTTIDIDKPTDETYPTLVDIVQAINLMTVSFTKGKQKIINGKEVWISATIGDVNNFCEIKIENVNKDEDFVKEISFGKSNEEIVIDFLLLLANENWEFLYYCDTGQMALISKYKTREEIETEIR